jgi:hypothetical protein
MQSKSCSFQNALARFSQSFLIVLEALKQDERRIYMNALGTATDSEKQKHDAVFNYNLNTDELF